MSDLLNVDKLPPECNQYGSVKAKTLCKVNLLTNREGREGRKGREEREERNA
ncbi:hypothetical protein [Nostoc sp.]|uniref:hypothetical protein n=1 Tax=Nostoc sp. TaxID=1180 RepID=UPI002FF590AC